MSSTVYSLIQNFIIGGSIIASISYLGTFFDPLIGAIWWSFPISLLPTLFFMQKHGKDNKYIAKFTISTTYALVLLVLSTAALSMFIKNNKSKSLWMPVLKTTGLWLIASVIFFGVIKYFKLADKFM